MAEESLSFMDQCTVICLGYISCYGNLEVKSRDAKDPESLQSLCTIADQELTEFGEKEELQNFLNSSAYLAEKWKNSDNVEDRISEGMSFFQSSLDQEAFNECADSVINLPIESWDKVSQILHLIYRACEQHGNAKVGTVIDVGVRYMRKNVTDFVIAEGGWRSLGVEKTAVTEQMTCQDDDISSSIVIVQHGGLTEDSAPQLQVPTGAGDAVASGKISDDPDDSINLQETSALSSPKNRTPLPLSPLNTPPFSIPSSTNTDDDRDSLATPPELVERPLMTDSFIRAMGGEELRRVSSGNGNDFEIIGSENGGAMTDTQSMTQSIDDAQAFEPPAEKEDIPSEQRSKTPSELGEIAPEAAIHTLEVAESPAEEPMFGGYLPHISLGVAAAAAVAGFFVLKKNM